MMSNKGKVFLVGAGPGAIELFTLKAVRLIQEADVILYDKLVNPKALSLVKPFCKSVFVGKHCGGHHFTQGRINKLLVEYAQAGKVVVRLKGGDPFIFGRGSEEAQYLLKHNIQFEVVPGVSSAISGPAYAGIPLTHRGLALSFAVITGHEAPRDISKHDWPSFKGIDTLVFLMGSGNRQIIAQNLVGVGRNPQEPVAFIENATTDKQRVIKSTLLELIENPPKVVAPAVMVVGEVVNFEESLRWFTRPDESYLEADQLLDLPVQLSDQN
jgi:uroporphyrin-III C-methyltransferase